MLFFNIKKGVFCQKNGIPIIGNFSFEPKCGCDNILILRHLILPSIIPIKNNSKKETLKHEKTDKSFY